MIPSLNVLGAGKLGTTIAFLLQQQHLVRVAGICNSSLASARNAASFIGVGTPVACIAELPAADITLIATPDDRIESCCQALVQESNLKQGSIVLHCSGALSSDVLSVAQAAHCAIASVHPLMSFASPQTAVERYRGVFCAMEGDVAALACLRPLFEAIGSTTFEISKENKTLYHAGSVFASNYLVALARLAQRCFGLAGIEDGVAKQLLVGLMTGTLANVQGSRCLKNALTGPIQRGDLNTVARHLDALQGSDLENIYAHLGQLTLELSRLDVTTQQGLRDRFLQSRPLE